MFARSTVFLSFFSLLAGHAVAQGSGAETRLSVLLDGLAQQETSCRLTFLAQNLAETNIEALVFEAVAFNSAGAVTSLSLFDFRDLPYQKLRVRQLDQPNTQCGDVSRILVNGIRSCEGEGLTPDICLDALSVLARGDVELLG